MPSKRGKKSKFKKVLIPVLKWASANIPVFGFFYILYYYKQFDFLKEKQVVTSETKVDSLPTQASQSNNAVVSKIRIVKNEWHSVGGIAIHNMVIENTSASLVKSVEVEFKYLNEMQGVAGSKIITIKTPLPPNKSTDIPGLSVGYVNNSVVGCDVKVLNARL